MDDDQRAQFQAECRTAGLELPDRERELLYEMWREWLPQRALLRAAVPGPDEEPRA